MKNKFLWVVLLAICCTTMNAKVWRLNPNLNCDADFRGFADALDFEVNEVQAGDTLYLDAGIYGDATSSRRLTIIGCGFGDGTNGNKESARCVKTGSISLPDSSAVYGIISNNSIYVGKYSTVDRCCAVILLKAGDYSCIKNCYQSSTTPPWVGYSGLLTGSFSTVIGNIATSISTGKNSYINQNVCIYETTYASYRNITAEYSTIENNIAINKSGARYKTIKFETNTVRNNVISDGTIPAGYENNTYEATVDGTFVCSGDNAEYYRLKEGCAAMTASISGGQCGAYGGNNPIEPSFRPLGVPYISDIILTQDVEKKIVKLSFKTKVQDE